MSSHLYRIFLSIPYPFLRNFRKLSSVLSKYFIATYASNFSTCYENSKNLYGPLGRSPCTLQTNLGLIPTIMLQGIVILHWTPVYLMIRNRFRILEMEYFPIHHPYLFLLNLWCWRVVFNLMSGLSNEPTNVGSILFATSYWTSFLMHSWMRNLSHTTIWRSILPVPVLPVRLPD